MNESNENKLQYRVLGRVVMLTNPGYSVLHRTKYHTLGKIVKNQNGDDIILSAVSRKVLK